MAGIAAGGGGSATATAGGEGFGVGSDAGGPAGSWVVETDVDGVGAVGGCGGSGSCVVATVDGAAGD
jgi:hypothetical protein